MSSADLITQLTSFLRQHPRLTVLTGAGCSFNSGIPTYRDQLGQWQRSEPIQHQAFLNEHRSRQRYWARSLVGWQHVCRAKPNGAHCALAHMEHQGRLEGLITQNVDGLHQQAGSNRVIDLHGRLDRVICLSCHTSISRADLQHRLAADNPQLVDYVAAAGPDGDADVDILDLSGVVVPDCTHCGGVLKPDVVFFGDNVPRQRVQEAMDHLQSSDALLVVGSSLMVFSGFRFCRQAAEWGKPIAIVNRGVTRADKLAALKIECDCDSLLEQVVGINI